MIKVEIGDLIITKDSLLLAVGRKQRIRLENTQSGHNKFWEVEIDPHFHIYSYFGAIGTRPRKSYKGQGSDLQTAEKVVENLIRDKIRKGYRKIGTNKDFHYVFFNPKKQKEEVYHEKHINEKVNKNVWTIQKANNGN